MIEIIKSPWESTFIRLLKEAKQDVYFASPYIKQQAAQLIIKNANNNIDFRYINSFKLSNFHRGASDLDALKILGEHGFKQKSVHSLHAKFFIFDNQAVITSSNLTPGGLKNNLEYGVLFQGNTVEEIKGDYLKIFNNPAYPNITPEIIKKAEDILASIPKEKQIRIKVDEKKLFEEILNDENVEEKFAGGIESIRANLTSWERDVFECLLDLDSGIFSLKEIYSFEKRLGQLHPKNQHVKDKIRQQLQHLRNIGLIEFIEPGKYKKLWI